MPQKVYIVELDAINGAALKKIDEVQQKMLVSSERMTAAYNRVNASLEKSMQKTSSTFNNFSRRDLGYLSSQLLYSTNITGRLSSQLTNLATGLATGGFIGAAFAGFSVLINILTEEFKDQKDELSGLRKQYDEILKKKGEMAKYDLEGYDALVRKKNELQKEADLWAGQVQFGLSQEDMLKYGVVKQKLQDVNEEIKFYVWALEKAGMFEDIVTKNVEKQLKIRKELNAFVVSNVNQEYEDLFNSLGGRAREPYGPAGLGGAGGAGGESKELVKNLEQAQNPMTALVSLSNQMASNFSFAGHTFVGQLSQAIAMLDSVSNMILTIASIFGFGGGGGGYGIGGLFGLLGGLEKGGRVTNLYGAISHTKIPSFAMGGSYSTPGFSGPFGGGYPVMVHKNETLDVYNAGQTSRMENKLDAIKNAIMAGTLASTRKGGRGSKPIVVNIDGKKLFEINQSRSNRANRSNKNVDEII